MSEHSSGYVAIVGAAGVGKSTLVQDVLAEYTHPFFIAYYAYLPRSGGNRDRGEALTFFQDVVERLDRFESDRRSLGISDIEQGREALRWHMGKAKQRYLLRGLKTILLIDGLDHVAREVGLQAPVLDELPPPEEIPEGFLIVLSGQPQALSPGTIPASVATEVKPGGRRLEMPGLTRAEVHALTAKIDKSTTGMERDALHAACQGNPLVLTYLLTSYQRTPSTTVDEAIRLAGHFAGAMDSYYRERLSIALKDAAQRYRLGLLCRAAPAILVRWLQEWPEKHEIEDIYERVLAPFLRIENGLIHFIHDSLVAFLKAETRTRLPGADSAVDEKAFYSTLADRARSRPCSDPVGRARIRYLSRASRHTDVLEQLSSPWLREAMQAFVPFAYVQPLLLSGLAAASATRDWGHALRLILLSHELDQRTSRMEAGSLAEALLRLKEPDLATSQIRSDDRLLVEDDVALIFARHLWEHAGDVDSDALKGMARSLYLQAKPIGLIYQSEPNDMSRSDHERTLAAWSHAAPLFEPTSLVASEIARLASLSAAVSSSESTETTAGLFFGALSTAIDAGCGFDDCRPLSEALATLGAPMWRFAGLLRLAEGFPTHVALEALQAAHDGAEVNDDVELAYAWFLFRHGHRSVAAEVVRPLRHVRFEPYRTKHAWGLSDVTFTVCLSRMQEELGLGEGPVPGVADERDEAIARVENVARHVGRLRALASMGRPVGDRNALYRSLLLFHNRSVRFAMVDGNYRHVLATSKRSIYREVERLAVAMGQQAVGVLRDVVLDLTRGATVFELGPDSRRRFADLFFREGVMSREEATDLGLATTVDAMDEDPRERQEACLAIATFLHGLGVDDGVRSWVRRASEVSAGARNHKDYHMASLAKWLQRSIKEPDAGSLTALDLFARAVEVAGGSGGSAAAARLLQLLLRLEPARASGAAVELIDRRVMNLSEVLEALIVGGAEALASPELLAAIYGELYSLLAPDDTASGAVAILRLRQRDQMPAMATRLMASVRTNGLPSHRAEVARDLDDTLREEALGELRLANGLKTPRDDSARRGQLYRLAGGGVETLLQVAQRLSDYEHPEAWNPNPTENSEFEWWSAIKLANIKSGDHLDRLLEAFAPPDYREVEVGARRARLILEMGDRGTARELAESLVVQVKNGSWHRWMDGAQKMTVFGLLKELDHGDGVKRAREQFLSDLSGGKLFADLLLSDIGDILEFLEIEWPAAAAEAAVTDYLAHVLAGNQQVPTYASMTGRVPSWSVDQALCRVVAHLLAFPMLDVAVAARRVLAQYLREADGSGLVALLAEDVEWDPIQLEHLLITLHVGAGRNRSSIGKLRAWIEGLSVHKSIAVRGVASRICRVQGWLWDVVTSQPAPPVILLPRDQGLDGDDEFLLGADIERTWRLFGRVTDALKRAGLETEEIRSAYEREYLALEKSYHWVDEERLNRWLSAVLARIWLRPRVSVGREAAMRTAGEYALSGQLPPGGEEAYDHLYPIYDPALELWQPTERPRELSAMEWRITGGEESVWLSGANADRWSSYPETVDGLFIIGEKSWFVRPEWTWPREERLRGVLGGPAAVAKPRASLEVAREVTYKMYLDGWGQEHDQLVVVNPERQLVSPAYRWAAINSKVARVLGWQPVDGVPFQWNDARGVTMVRSVYWRDGWIWLAPPRFESLGEGWLVLATSPAVDALRSFAPQAAVHLWIDRRSHGEKSYAQRWQLSKPL